MHETRRNSEGEVLPPRTPQSPDYDDKLAGMCGSLEFRIEACRQATKTYRDAWALADRLTRELKAEGLCGHCAIANHGYCSDYGCVCCGGGK